ncbi:MAG: RDD family protein [Candidatus Acidiferrales bacterium]
MFCSKCGAQVAEGTAFCGACGQPTGGAPHVAPPPTVAVAGAGGNTVAVYGSPGSVSPYPPAAVPAILPSPYAGFWLRLLAYIIDSVVIGMAFGVFVLIVVAIVGIGYFRTMFEGMNGEDATVPAAFMAIILFATVISVVAGWLYYAWMESSQYQGTLGKMALGLTVTDLQGRRVTFARASGRFFAKIITGLIPVAIGYIMAGFTEKKQALHDMIASCLVLRKT